MPAENLSNDSGHKSHTEGLNTLFDFNRTGEGLFVDGQVFHGKNKVRPIVRGKVTEVVSNPSTTLRRDPVFRWIRRDSQGFERLALRDQDVKRGLATIDHLVQELSEISQDRGKTQINTLAVAEKAEEIAALAAPYIPRDLKKELEKTDPKNDEKNLQNQEKEKNKNGSLNGPKLNATLPSIPFPKFNLPRIGLPNFIKNSVRDLKDQLRKEKKIRVYSGGNLLHPLLTRDQQAGRDRRWKSQAETGLMMKLDKEMMTSEEPGFIITKYMNRYNPATGELKADAPSTQYSLHRANSYGNEIATPLGKIESFEFVGIPLPLKENSRASSYSSESLALCDIELTTEDNKQLANWVAIRDYLKQDSLGNVFIDLPEFLNEYRQEIKGKNVVLHTKYSGYSYTDQEEAEYIGSMPDEERYRINLYPKEIQRFIEVMLKKKQRNEKGFQSNVEIFSRLAQFIGSFWLTYDLQDAISNHDEPNSFQQTERVLAGNVASCEGSNIALGQLMRYFLDKNEGIAYVEGFVADSSTITSRDLHLKVVYIDDEGSRHFFDATPWSAESQMYFEVISRRRHAAAEEWYAEASELREGDLLKLRKELPARLSALEERFEKSWQSEKSIPEAFLKELKEMELVSRFDYRNNAGITKLIRSYTEITKKGLLRRKNVRIFENDLGIFLRNLHGLTENQTNYWRFPRKEVDGAIDFRLNFLKGNLYDIRNRGSMSHFFYDYLSDEVKSSIVNDSLNRTKLFEEMSELSREALIASSQNIEAISVVVSHIEELSASYQQRFVQIFETVSDSLSVSPETFLKSAPFLLLLKNPYSYIENVFVRSKDKNSRGFLLPSDPQEIIAELDRQLNGWQYYAEYSLREFSKIIAKAPKTGSRETVEVSSTYLWQELSKNIPQEKGKKKKYLDPIKTFFYLYYGRDY